MTTPTLDLHAWARRLAQAEFDRLEADCERALHLTDPDRWGGLCVVQLEASLGGRHADMIGWIASAWPTPGRWPEPPPWHPG